jgi:D-alanine-D-alanine ligase
MTPSPTPAATARDEHKMSTAKRTLRITVLAGGPSAEREVSLESGRAVADALRRRGHDVFVADIGPEQLAALDHPADVVFPALHGTFGEDGAVQAILAARGLPFVGSDAPTSALAMDKVATKRALASAGITTPEFELWDAATLRSGVTTQLTLPVIVKPVDQGSSVGTAIVRAPGAFDAAVRETIRLFRRALVEEYVVGDELTVGIVGDQVLPPICIRPKRTFYDYEAKYQDNATEYLFDTGIPAAVLKTAQELSWRAFERLGCRHLGRVDWMIDRQHGLWFLEVNTIPGFTSHSLVPKAAAHVGISFDELVERLVFMAYEARRA